MSECVHNRRGCAYVKKMLCKLINIQIHYEVAEEMVLFAKHGDCAHTRLPHLLLLSSVRPASLARLQSTVHLAAIRRLRSSVHKRR